MNAEICIVTFKRDFQYLRHCLRSIKRFASGFSGVTIVIPKEPPLTYDETFDFVDSHLTLLTGDEWPDNPMLWHEWVIMCADEWCPNADFIVHLDADCIFTAPVTPETYIENGKPILRWEPFQSVARREPGVMEWERVTRRCLPYPNLVETMRCMPLVYQRGTYELARQLICATTGKDAGEYIRSCKGTHPEGFCEFVTLGNVALREHPERYTLVNQRGDAATPPNFVQQFWSRGPLDLKQNIWVMGVQKSVVPINFINEVLGPEDNKPVAPVSGERELPAILTKIDHRDNLALWLNNHGFTGAGAEIGVMHGGWSETILKGWKGEKYYMVDPWVNQPITEYLEKHDDIDYEQKYRDCVAIAGRFPIVEIIRDYSIPASTKVKDGSLDWVHIDANHKLKAVLEDMDAWFPKLKRGGLMSGHDLYNARTDGHFCEVLDAVERWTSEHNIKYHKTPCSSWWLIKP